MKGKQRFAATIGFFDGVHRGHRYLIERLKSEARRRGLATMVITFDRHPREVLCAGWHPQLLTTTEEKRQLLLSTGIDRLVVLLFDEGLSRLSARDFMSQQLKPLGVDLLLTGYDNHFGCRTANSQEGFADYQAYGRELQIEVTAGEPLAEGELRYSSSLVRRMLSQGDVAGARHCLDRCYALSGTVVHGEQIGRSIGFPTANIQPEESRKLIPSNGVYAVRAGIDHESPTIGGIMNIGCRPTFGGHERTLEVHLLDFNADIYGHRLNVSFIDCLRQEQHFDSPQALAVQMQKDAAMARKILAFILPSR